MRLNSDKILRLGLLPISFKVMRISTLKWWKLKNKININVSPATKHPVMKV
jgi:hypothetical protein